MTHITPVEMPENPTHLGKEGEVSAPVSKKQAYEEHLFNPFVQMGYTEDGQPFFDFGSFDITDVRILLKLAEAELLVAERAAIMEAMAAQNDQAGHDDAGQPEKEVAA